LLVKEYKQVMSLLKVSTDIASSIASGDPADIAKHAADLNKITVDDWDGLQKIVKRCYSLDDSAMDDMHYADVLFLFIEVVAESKNPKKKSLTPSTSA
jgi:hypothetical protein